MNWSDLSWCPEAPSPVILERLERALGKWTGTRYKEGCQRPQAGVDCWRFVSAVADDMRQRAWVPLPRMMADVSMHCAPKARAALRWAMRAHSCRRVYDAQLRPGDVLIAGPPGGGPGHAMIAGPDKSIWHVVQGTGVDRVGICSFGLDLFGVLRVKESLWAPL